MVGLREYQDAKADVIMKYNSDEARRLKNMGQLPDTVNVRIFNSKKILFFLDFFFENFFRSNSVSQTTTILFSKMTIPIMTRMRLRPSRTSRKSGILKNENIQIVNK